MTITADDLELLRAYIGANDSDDALLDAAWSSAVALLDDFLSNPFREVPADVRQGFNLEVAQEIWKRREAVPSGNTAYAAFDGATVMRGPRDPLAVCMPSLRRYVVSF